ncbi:electron transporter RnfD [Thermosipho melanesiensis]|uniref:Ion-translocating oxidoreductase complex subunit D n=2 Tax=Thermosipho melanesiensis TaxID=46541 RepID=A6LNB5_THEM4|nr:RnfABCDGE type electron transport complex subunit D [Thermosipho melanesiensis]ABR31416.1 electron transport complex, RnfABCDGE type, D subunit [Thermosipho melanesiensis BI429]APT74475.1 electron transporter RnfD [Thermosipho melanesiensis]OOC36435.1 electron transporter RnfD [Thermosipho melanesiensis]OOC37253.1 electron transporter RnfD [Thermosipho melanesiensis]OOC38005.1 electron transporter RnfD [Thermosipho melanesiensis]
MKLITGNAPHLRSNDTTEKVMIDVIIALIPAIIGAWYFFGEYALFLILLGAFSGELFELFVMKVLRKDKNFVPNGSAAITGILLAMNVSSATPWWVFLIGLVFALGVAKHAFGGLGMNIFNPALAGRAFLLVSFPVSMTTWYKPVFSFSKWVDIQTMATPLAVLKETGSVNISYWDLFIGNRGGSLGETSVLLLLIGFAYLVVKKRIKIMIPITYISTVFVMSGIFYLVNSSFGSPLFHILSGGLMLGALFMATDMVTSPMTVKGQIIFGIGLGVMTLLIRYFAGYPEGVSLSILLMNAFVPLIDRYTVPKVFGEVKA